jgi:hypothetical protein
MDSIDEQIFTLLPFEIVILNPVIERKQTEFIS